MNRFFTLICFILAMHSNRSHWTRKCRCPLTSRASSDVWKFNRRRIFMWLLTNYKGCASTSTLTFNVSTVAIRLKQSSFWRYLHWTSVARKYTMNPTLWSRTNILSFVVHHDVTSRRVRADFYWRWVLINSSGIHWLAGSDYTLPVRQISSMIKTVSH